MYKYFKIYKKIKSVTSEDPVKRVTKSTPVDFVSVFVFHWTQVMNGDRSRMTMRNEQ